MNCVACNKQSFFCDCTLYDKMQWYTHNNKIKQEETMDLFSRKSNKVAMCNGCNMGENLCICDYLSGNILLCKNCLYSKDSCVCDSNMKASSLLTATLPTYPKIGIVKEEEDKGKHYRHEFCGKPLDPYRIMQIYEITHPIQQHIVKKGLRGCSKGHSELDLVNEILCAATRWKQMIEEDTK